MIRSFVFEFPTIIEFGEGKSQEIMHAIKRERAQKVLVVTDRVLMALGIVDPFLSILAENDIDYIVYDDVQPNPLSSQVDACGADAVLFDVDMLVAIGGGSVMDTAKGAAVIAANGGEIEEYLLLRGDGMIFPEKMPLPVLAVPTTAGTGSEVSDCIVITDKNKNKDLMLTTDIAPRYAYVDPVLTFSLPPMETAMCGFGVLGNALEAYVSNVDCHLAEVLGLESISLVFDNLAAAVYGNEDARIKMSLASVYAGIAQSKVGCVLPHAISCPLSAKHNIPHGHGVAAAQIPTIHYLKDIIPEKYLEIMRYLGDSSATIHSAADHLIDKIHDLFFYTGLEEKIKLDVEITDELIQELSEDAMKGVDINGCPGDPVNIEDIIKIFKQILAN